MVTIEYLEDEELWQDFLHGKIKEPKVVLKGGLGSGHFGHKGIPNHQGGSLPRGVLAAEVTKPKSLEDVGLIEVDTLDSGAAIITGDGKIITGVGGVTPNYDVHGVKLNKIAIGYRSHTQIFARMVMLTPEKYSAEVVDMAKKVFDDNAVEDSRFEHMAWKFDEEALKLSINIHTLPTDVTVVGLNKNYITRGFKRVQRMIMNGKIDAPNVKFLSLHFDTKFQNIPYKDVELVSGIMLQEDGHINVMYKELTILKGGLGSGFYGHAGRPGQEGGSTPRGIMPKGVLPVQSPANYGLYTVLNSDKFPDKMKTTLKLMYDRMGTNYIPDNSVVLTKIAPNIKRSPIRSEGGFGACAKVSLDAVMEDPSLKLYYGIAYDKYDIQKYEEFDAHMYWGEVHAGLPHIWNVDTQNRVVDYSFGSRGSAGTIYVGTEINPKDFDYDEAKVLHQLYDTMNKDTNTLDVMKRLYAEWDKLDRDVTQYKGGPGSGHFDHRGIPGHRGGSLPKGILSSSAINPKLSGTKVLDVQGNPAVVYHGTSADFDTFDPHKIGQIDAGYYGRGFYFTENPEMAAYYASQGFGSNVAPNIRPVYLIIKNPLEVHSRNDLFDMFGDDARYPAVITQKLKDMGYDGVIVRSTEVGLKQTMKEIVVFEPDQIVSIFSVSKNIKYKGGLGSGFYGHAGRPGQEGGSVKRGIPRGILPPQELSANTLNPHDDTSPSDDAIKNPYEKVPTTYGRRPVNTSEDNSAAYIPAWGKNEDSKQSDYHPESQVHAWIDPDLYFSPLTHMGENPILHGFRDRSGIMDRERVDAMKELMKNKQPLDAVWYDVNITTGAVVNQEGRHRAFAAHELGIDRIPLIIYFKDANGKAVDVSTYDKKILYDKNPLNYFMVNSYSSLPSVMIIDKNPDPYHFL